jgi:acyl dehydratase
MITFLQGWGGPFLMSSEILHKYLRRHPKANVCDRETNAPDTPERAHWDEAYARECGFPSGYDIGGQRFSWLVHALTNWMGDAGFLRKMTVRFVAFNLLGDTQWCGATVTGTRVDDGAGVADLKLYCINQDGNDTAVGTAEVILPRRPG